MKQALPDILKKECSSVYRQLALFYRQESLH